MFPFSSIKIIAALIITLVIAGGLWYVSGLRAELAISEENTKKMILAVEQQQVVIEQMKADQEAINKINKELNTKVKAQNADLDSLKERLTTNKDGTKRDFGAIAIKKPDSIERAINRGTVNALRCLEIASGSPLTEAEKNAKLPSEINKECPSLANPNYSAVGTN